MVAKISFHHFLSLYGIYAKMDLAWLMRDRIFACLAILSDLASNLASVTGIFLLAWRFGEIGGMNKYEVLFMLSYGTMVSGLFQMFFSGNNTGYISRRIGRGQLEHMFIQPVPLGAQLLCEGFIPFSGSSSLFCGIFLMWISCGKLSLALPPWWIISLAGNLLVSVWIIIALSYLVSSIAFYAPAQAEELSSFVIDSCSYLSTFPLSGMPLYLKLPLLTVLPAGLLGWFPTMVLLGKPHIFLPAAFPALAAVLFSILAAYLFKKGLRFYVKKGINRYSSAGHRR